MAQDSAAEKAPSRFVDLLKRSIDLLRRSWQISRSYLALTVVGLVGLVAATLPLDCHSSNPEWFCADKDMLATIAQVIPATVVAIFVFALGTTFVMAQILVPSRGSRSIGVLISYTRVQAVIVGGLMLLGGSLVITLGTYRAEDPTPWSLALATVLVVATVVYLLVATCLIVWTFLDQLSPRRFNDRLTKPRPLSPIGWRGWRSEELFRVLRVLRGWLRTVNRVGESRDLQFAVEGVRRLIKAYAQEVWKKGKHRTICSQLYREPASYEETKRSAEMQLAHSPSGSGRPGGRDAGRCGSNGGPPWFADELGRALTRTVESGVRGNTLRRDLDRLLNLFELGIQEFTPCDAERPVLTDEVRTLIRHLTEVALGVRQCEDWQRNWFVAPALRLARIEQHLEDVGNNNATTWSTGRPDPDSSLARTALVGWLLAGDAISSVEPEVEASFLERSIPLLGNDNSVWDIELACEEWLALEPDWDVQVESYASRHKRLRKRLAKARRRKFGAAGFRGRRPLDRLDTVSGSGGGAR